MMSGLNDDVEDGLDFSPEVAEINKDQPVTDTKIFTPAAPGVQETTPTPQDLFGSQVISNEVPNLNAEFVLVKESINKLKDLQYIASCIAQSNGISKEDAIVVDSMMPGFINDKKPIGFFTEDKSRTQFNETLNSINKTIDTQVAELSIKSLELTDKAISSLTACIKEAEPKIIARLFSLAKELGRVIDFINSEDNQSNEISFLVNLLNTRLDNLPFDYRDLQIDKEKFSTFIEAFNKNNSFIQVIRNFENINLLLKYCLSYQNDGENPDPIHIVAFNNYTRIDLKGDTYPIGPSLDPLSVKNCSYTLYHLLLLGAGNGAKQYLMSLVNAVVILITSISKIRESIEVITKSDVQDHQDKLNKLFCLHSQVNIDSINSVLLLTFVQNYCDYIESLAKAFCILLPDSELQK